MKQSFFVPFSPTILRYKQRDNLLLFVVTTIPWSPFIVFRRIDRKSGIRVTHELFDCVNLEQLVSRCNWRRFNQIAEMLLLVGTCWMRFCIREKEKILHGSLFWINGKVKIESKGKIRVTKAIEILKHCRVEEIRNDRIVGRRYLL